MDYHISVQAAVAVWEYNQHLDLHTFVVYVVSQIHHHHHHQVEWELMALCVPVEEAFPLELEKQETNYNRQWTVYYTTIM
jgi:hypothetical protein